MRIDEIFLLDPGETTELGHSVAKMTLERLETRGWNFLHSEVIRGVTFSYWSKLNSTTPCISVWISGADIKTLFRGERDKLTINDTKEDIEDNTLYSVSSLSFKPRPTFSQAFPSLVSDRVLQVNLVTTSPDFQRLRLARRSYEIMANLGYILFSDYQQTGAGKEVWNWIISMTSENATFESPSEYSVFLLTSRGVLIRDVNDEPKPVQQRYSNRLEKTVSTVSGKEIWDAARTERNKSTLLMFGKTDIMKSYIIKTKTPTVKYTNFTNEYRGLDKRKILMTNPRILLNPNNFSTLYRRNIQDFVDKVKQNMTGNKSFEYVAKRLLSTGELDRILANGALIGDKIIDQPT